MKVGDRLYCHSVKNGMNDISSNFDIGQSYEVLSIVFADNRVYVRTKYSWMDEWFNEWFNISVVLEYDDDRIFPIIEDWYYGNYFYTIKELRKVKLDRLKKVYMV